MTLPTQARCSYEITPDSENRLVIHLEGVIDSSGAAALIAHLRMQLRGRSFSELIVDFSRVNQPDDFSILVGLEMKKIAARTGASCQAVGAPDFFSTLLKEYPVRDSSMQTGRPTKNILTRCGASILALGMDFVSLVRFVGQLCLAVWTVVRRPRTLRLDDTLIAMQRIGVDALPIVGLISFLLGLIMAFMSAVQLRQFGANIYVASLVSLAMARELGPIMTAIIVAGRSGSAFAAEISTMKISDEIDALTTMGFEPVHFLVVPRLIASVIMVPLLVLFSDLFAMVGGLIVGVGMLEITAGAYIAQTVRTLELFDVFWGVFKAGVFAVLIAWIGCFRGFEVRGGAAAVGEATTSAVVSGIFLIIFADAVFAVILRYWG